MKGPCEDSSDLTRSLDNCFDAHEIAALESGVSLEQLLREDPRKAIEMVPSILDRGLNTAYTQEDGTNVRSFVQATCGGPCETVPQAVYNAVGDAYPMLSRELKDRAVCTISRILDRQNYLTSQLQIEGLREPLLIADLVLASNHLYWPGLNEGCSLLKKYDDFFEIWKEIAGENGLFDRAKVNSDFLVAYALLRSDICRFGRDYIRVANPNFLNRVVKGIVALRFAPAKGEGEIKIGTTRLQELLPEELHSQIESLRQERDWTKVRSF